jgi:flagellar biosynthesis/type III secretory pathway protein FliH
MTEEERKEAFDEGYGEGLDAGREEIQEKLDALQEEYDSLNNAHEELKDAISVLYWKI